ncbi:hypothetical protein [Streptomyces sp. MMBL 11-1]|uniref:hypothetical protein n=1 Tax=Streptomyces sp. MMBL 11-1 TaxID=3026420 RepID=UPI0023607C1F|nr:hypothetical protein [Streptomyces sp. MMBL 11-1]
MEVGEIAESTALSVWFSTATACPSTAIRQWQASPHAPRRLKCGVTFDVVLVDRRLVKAAFRLLDQYEQPLGPAVRFTSLSSAAVLVPSGTVGRWGRLVAASQWPGRLARPVCLGEGHALVVPAPAPLAATGVARWLFPPDEEQTIGGVPLLTSPGPLARCLAEALTSHAPVERTPLRRAVAAVKSALPYSGRP